MSATQSVLDAMTAGILDRKAGKSAKAGLTPVRGEAPRGIPDVPEVFLTNEAVTDVARNLREQAALLVQVADALDRMTATPTGVDADPAAAAEAERKAREQEADRRIAEAKASEVSTEEDWGDHFKRLQADAQKAAFTPDIDAPPRVGSAAPGWECPNHGSRSIEQKTSRKGRVYRVCTQCPEFEK